MEQRNFSLSRTLKVLFELNSLEQNLKKINKRKRPLRQDIVPAKQYLLRNIFIVNKTKKSIDWLLEYHRIFQRIWYIRFILIYCLLEGFQKATHFKQYIIGKFAPRNDLIALRRRVLKY